MLSTFEIVIYSAALVVLLPTIIYALITGSGVSESSRLAKYYHAERYLNLADNLLLLTICAAAVARLGLHFGYIDASLSDGLMLAIGLEFGVALLASLGLWIRVALRVHRGGSAVMMELLEKRLLPFAVLALTAYAYGWPDPRAWNWSVTLAAVLALVIIVRTLPERNVVFAPPVVPKEVWRFCVSRLLMSVMTILLALAVLWLLNRADGASLDAIRTLAAFFAVYALAEATAD